MMIVLKTIVVWMLIIAAETVHGVLRTIFLAPMVGDFRARQLAVFTGCFLIFTVAYFLTAWIGAKTKKQLLAVGAFWVALTVLFEISLGRFVLELSWYRIAEDYDLSRGGLLGFGLLFMTITPILVARLRRIAPFMQGKVSRLAFLNDSSDWQRGGSSSFNKQVWGAGHYQTKPLGE